MSNVSNGGRTGHLYATYVFKRTFEAAQATWVMCGSLLTFLLLWRFISPDLERDAPRHIRGGDRRRVAAGREIKV